MDFLTATILSGVIYDIFKYQVTITKDILAKKLRNWLIDDITLENLTNKIKELDLNSELSEKAIEKRINTSDEIISLMKTVSANKVIIQTHSGTGDNIGGNKNIYGKNND
ncbi:GapS6a family protein [Leminorella grimontii]|uniref:GapS6a family protein n=1 Tax=Leminorella grimontii TaxID=82981 RepID=UPI00208803F7|nr:hypothetical protein [Leminorella grimontii]GKX60347.1 hypothetical protein SOASR031_26620 [Leminorella grimontii]